MGAWRTPREGRRAATLPILTQFRVFVKTKSSDLIGFGAPPPGLAGARRAGTGTPLPLPYRPPLFCRQATAGTPHRAPGEAAEPAWGTRSADAGPGRFPSRPLPAAEYPEPRH